MRIFEWWGDLSPIIRYGVAFALLAISTALYFAGTIWPWGWVVGAIMLLLAGPSDSEKRGYRF